MFVPVLLLNLSSVFHFFSVVLIACRSISKGQQAIEKIEEQTGIKGKLSVISLDLSSQESVKAFTRQFKTLGYSSLDVLVNSKAEKTKRVLCLFCLFISC